MTMLCDSKMQQSKLSIKPNSAITVHIKTVKKRMSHWRPRYNYPANRPHFYVF